MVDRVAKFTKFFRAKVSIYYDLLCLSLNLVINLINDGWIVLLRESLCQGSDTTSEADRPHL